MEKITFENRKADINKIKQLANLSEELAWQLILGNHNCKFRALGVIGYNSTDPSVLPTASVETLFLLDVSEETQTNIGGLKMNHRANIHRMHKCFILDMEYKEIFEEVLKMKQEDPVKCAKFIIDLKPKFFKL